MHEYGQSCRRHDGFVVAMEYGKHTVVCKMLDFLSWKSEADEWKLKDVVFQHAQQSVCCLEELDHIYIAGLKCAGSFHTVPYSSSHTNNTCTTSLILITV